MNRASVFEWFKEARESVRDDKRCGRSKDVNTPELIGQRVRVRVTVLRVSGSSGRDSVVGGGQYSSNRVSGISSRTMHQSTTPSLSQTICQEWHETVPQPSYSSDLASCDFLLFPKLIGCRYETIEEMKEALTKVIDTLTHEDFHGTFWKLLERYDKCIAAGGDYFVGESSFMCVLSIKVPIRKKVWKLI